jgi:hypothetical protein
MNSMGRLNHVGRCKICQKTISKRTGSGFCFDQHFRLHSLEAQSSSQSSNDGQRFTEEFREFPFVFPDDFKAFLFQFLENSFRNSKTSSDSPNLIHLTSQFPLFPSNQMTSEQSKFLISYHFHPYHLQLLSSFLSLWTAATLQLPLIHSLFIVKYKR